MRATAVIPARGGSKGIPRKNLVPVCGKPLVVWSIEAALESLLVKHVLVSTDDKEIASIAHETGAEVVIRPPEMAIDEAPTDPVMVHAIERSGCYEEFTVLLQPTSPLRPKQLIDNCIRELVASQANSIFTGCYSHHFAWHRMAGWNGDPLKRQGLMRPLTFSITGRRRRQDMSITEIPFLENGNVYVTRTDLLIKHGNRIVEPVQGYEIPEIYSIDINHDFELAHADLLMRQLINNEKKTRQEKEASVWISIRNSRPSS